MKVSDIEDVIVQKTSHARRMQQLSKIVGGLKLPKIPTLGELVQLHNELVQGDRDSKQMSTHRINVSIVRSLYPPSSAPLESLRSSRIRDLRVETQAIGCQLILECRTESCWQDSLYIVCQDDFGDAVRVKISQLVGNLRNHTFVKGTKFIVKEPYLELYDVDRAEIRIDHTGDLIVNSDIVGSASSFASDAVNRNGIDTTSQNGDLDDRLKPGSIGGKAYDFESSQSSKTSSFSDLTSISTLPNRGRGVVAIGRIPEDEIVLREQATAISQPLSLDGDVNVVVNLPLMVCLTGPQLDLVQKVALIMQRDHFIRQEMLKYYAGSVFQDPAVDLIVDGKQVFDCIRLQGIVGFNSFQIAQNYPSEQLDTTSRAHETSEKPYTDPVGLWTNTALMNHSCAPNCTVLTDGEWKVIKTSRTIEKGEELTIAYCDPMSDHSDRQRRLRHTWGFVCQCSKCMLDLQRDSVRSSPIVKVM